MRTFGCADFRVSDRGGSGTGVVEALEGSRDGFQDQIPLGLCLIEIEIHFGFPQVLFKDGSFQWKRLVNLIVLAKENVVKMSSTLALQVLAILVDIYYSSHRSSKFG